MILLGDNQGANQKGMSIGSQRHITNIPSDEMDKDSESLVTHQSGMSYCNINIVLTIYFGASCFETIC